MVDPGQMPHYVVPDLGLHCLSVSHKKDDNTIYVANLCKVHQSAF